MSNTDGEDTQPLREHFEMDTDAGTTLRTFDYIDALEKYNEQLSKQLKQKDQEIARLYNDLADVLDFKNGKGTTALSMLHEKLKQKEDENRELVKGIMEVFNGCKTSAAGYANDGGEFAKGKAQAYQFTAKKIKDLLTWLGHDLSA